MESELLGSGSVAGVISGKHFNRCKRLHLIVYASLQKLLLRSFLEQENIQLGDSIKTALENLQKVECTIDEAMQNSDVEHILSTYEEYQRETLNGVHGKTPQFFALYLQLIGNNSIFFYVYPIHILISKFF